MMPLPPIPRLRGVISYEQAFADSYLLPAAARQSLGQACRTALFNPLVTAITSKGDQVAIHRVSSISSSPTSICLSFSFPPSLFSSIMFPLLLHCLFLSFSLPFPLLLLLLLLLFQSVLGPVCLTYSMGTSLVSIPSPLAPTSPSSLKTISLQPPSLSRPLVALTTALC